MLHSLRSLSRVISITVGCSFIAGCSSNAMMTESAQQVLVDQATVTVQTFFNDTTTNSRPQKLLTQARAVMICPSLFNMSVILGGTNGRCLLLNRDARGSWSDPAFYQLSGGSFGLQLGYRNIQLILFIMSQRGIQALLDHQFTFDANTGVSFADLGNNIQSSHANGARSDIYPLQRANGLFAGASLGGTKLSSDSAANRAYYQKNAGPENIVINMRVNNSAADSLRRALMNAAPAPASISSRKTK